MWAAIVMVVVLNGSQIEMSVAADPEVYRTEAQCNEAQKQLQLSERVKGFSLKCVKFDKEDFKAVGKES